ncbi:transmembrane protein, putative [Medicago truncatula]|uniref:Transmembrane protein, putative n=1 Tax=Medicago truncatula TaxID=3880 RepID=A0A072U812_MEDTR|nr:transmembrane protein, putative [Medicago truncatula]
MADWAPIVIGLILFVLFSPGLLFQLPGKGRVVEFVNFQTSAISIFVHSLLFFGFMWLSDRSPMVLICGLYNDIKDFECENFDEFSASDFLKTTKEIVLKQQKLKLKDQSIPTTVALV